MNSKTKEAIKLLYKVFKRYRFTDMEGDPAFPGMCDPAPLLAKPLHALPREAFDTFAWKAVTTWGTADDFRHFLPRMLELIAVDGECGRLEYWALFSKMEYAKWRDWPAIEHKAIEQYVKNRWSDLLFQEITLKREHQHLRKTQPDNYLKFMGSIEFLEPTLYHDLLGEWSGWIDDGSNQYPILHLAEFYIELNDSCPIIEPHEIYRDWLLEQKRIEQLALGWEKSKNDAMSQYLSDAHTAAENWINITKEQI